jgi:hypothetical protein
MSVIIKILPVEADYFHMDRRTGMMQLIVAFVILQRRLKAATRNPHSRTTSLPILSSDTNYASK